MTTLKVNVIRKPTIRVKVLPNFPSSVTVTSPIVLNSAGGNYAFSFDQSALGAVFIVNADNITLGSQTGTGAMVRATSPTLVTPALGTPSAVVLTNATGTAAGLTAGTVTTNANLSGDTTSVGNVTTFATVNANVGTFGSATQSIQITANAKGLLTAAANVTITPAIGSVTGLGTGVATFLATPSSANLRAALTDEVGTGAAYFVGGALGTPASGTATNLTGLPLSGLTTQAAFTFVGNNTSGAAVPTAVDIHALTLKASPAASDEVIISDQAASGAWKRSPVSSLASASGVSSIAGNTGAFTLSNGISNATNDIRLATIAAGSVLGNNTTSSAIPAAVSVPVLLNTLTASSSATLSDTTSFTSTYSAYELVFQNIIPATAAVNLQLLVHSGGSFPATSYVTQTEAIAAGAAAFAQQTTFLQIGSNQNNAGPGISGSARVFAPTGTAVAKQWTCHTGGQNSSPAAVLLISSGYWNSTAAVDGFQVSFTSGNITSGIIKIYGIP